MPRLSPALAGLINIGKFSFSTTCGYPVDPTKPVAEGVMPSESQYVTLGGKTLVGVSCDVPGFELRTYRKK
jgi:hypothetical protein